jgi:predicted ribosome quality control (RQC) complex YloA/Tae2 family protein
MADSRSRGFEAKEQKLQEKLDKLQSRYDNAREILEQQGGVMDTSRVRGAEILQKKIDEVKQQLKDLRKARGDGSTRTSTQVKEPITVKPHPGLDRKDVELFKDPDSSKPPMPKNRPAIVDTPSKKRPAIVDTPSKKPLAKRIMEALGDKRTMEQASEDARVTKEMEMEREMNVAGRKKGGMAKKKKAPVKKAYGGMVKKKQGGSANKVNMKAGFTRRGCLKG